MIDAAKNPSSPAVLSHYYNNTAVKKPKDLSLFTWFSSFSDNLYSINSKTASYYNTPKPNRTHIIGSVPNLIEDFDSIEALSYSVPEEPKRVEDLTQYWNRRISFTNNLQQKQTNRANFKSQINSIAASNGGLKSSKSVGCLLTKTNNELNSESFNRNDIPIETNIEDHIRSDNFYKYKTADTKKRRSFDNYNRNLDTKSCSNAYCFDTSSQHQHQKLASGIESFPLIAATEKGEKIHWAKREDIVYNRKQKSQSKTPDAISDKTNQKIFDDRLLAELQNITADNDRALSVRELIRNNKNLFDKKKSNSKKKPQTVEKIKMEVMNSNQSTTKTNNDCKFVCKESSISNSNAMSPSVTLSPHCPSNTPTTQRNCSKDKTDSDNESCAKISVSSRHSVESLTKKKHQPQTPRKYSFKTHTKNFHMPRKMIYQNGNHHPTSGSGNKVATLTAQFNQLIQKDNTILEEIKKKNGVILARGGHIYKVKEDSSSSSPVLRKKNSTKRSSSNASGEDSSSKRISTSNRNSKVNSVKTTAKIFESSPSVNGEKPHVPVMKPQKMLPYLSNKVAAKPRVPEKSEAVLKMTKEIDKRNTIKKIRPNLIEIQTNFKLEDIKEEAKTPTHEVKDITASKGDDKTETSEYAKVGHKAGLNGQENDLHSPSNETSSATSEAQPKKSRYARIYEKIRFKGPLFAHKKDPVSYYESAKKILIQPDSKIRNAIETVDRKLEILSKSTSDVTQNDAQTDDSFSNTKTICFSSNAELITKYENDHSQLVQAINTCLVNKTKSMDNLRMTSTFNSLFKVQDLSPSIKDEDFELYEPIEAKKKASTLLPPPRKSFVFERFQSCNESVKSNESDQLRTPSPDSRFSKSSLTPTSTTPKTDKESFIFSHKKLSTSITESQKEDDSWNIYQTISEALATQNSTEKSHTASDEADRIVCDPPNSSKLSFGYQTDDGYEICKPNDVSIPNNVINQKGERPTKPSRTAETQRNTKDELPAIPEPKLNITSLRRDENPVPQSFGLYNLPFLNIMKLAFDSKPEVMEPTILDDDENHYEDEDSIYHMIKDPANSLHCYEQLHGNEKLKSMDDSISLESNCYESIPSVRRVVIPLANSDSNSTISSDNKTNSLYEVSMHSHKYIAGHEGSSGNDDWTDISDGDEDKATSNKFIIVREKSKPNKGAEWSTLVHNHRQAMQADEDEDYDSEHIYEPLCPIVATTKPNQISSDSSLHTTISRPTNSVDQNVVVTENNESNKRNDKLTAVSNRELFAKHLHSDDDDSFDTDDETDEDVKKSDSGVDISNKKLPEPPTATNQVYAFVKKFKNFISNKKIVTKNNESENKYENTTFFVKPNEYQTTNYATQSEKKPSRRRMHSTAAHQNADKANVDLYENTEFHKPIRFAKQISSEKSKDSQISTSVGSSPAESVKPNTNKQISSNSMTEPDSSNSLEKAAIDRRKSKSDNSFKSKLKKSFISPPNNNESNSEKQSTTARSTFYISDSVDLDSGIFEKAHSSSNQTLIDYSNQEEQSRENKTEIDSANLASSLNEPTTLGRKNRRSQKSPDLQRRRTTIGIRPNNPPPPPPVDKKATKKRPQTSWYAECGVFKANGFSEEINSKNQSRNESANSNSLYAEAGLYQTSGLSAASSSGSSGVSTAGDNCQFDDKNFHSMFSNEPLYQIYSAEKLESISRDMEYPESADGYEEITTLNKKPSRPSALQLVGPKCGPSRTLWCEIPEVINSHILATLTTQEKRLQEAKFEILTSEASYLKSLNLLRSHFMNHPGFRDTTVLSAADRKALFSHIIPVQECSDRLLCDLESCWQDNIMLIGLSQSIFKNAEKYFHVYIAFCEHQGKMDRLLRRLKEQKGLFNHILLDLEKDPVCYGLDLHSFLMLPMQRITRLPLLIDAVFSKVKADDSEYENWKMALSILNKIVLQCNEAANRCEQSYEIEKISKQIEFPATLRSLAVAPVGVLAPGTKPRYLVKRGELTHLVWRRGDDAKLTFGKKFSKINVYAFLFTDLLILTKRKSDELFTVFDYCSRNMVTVSAGDSIPHLPIKDTSQIGKNLILMTLLENHQGKTVEMIISCPSVSEKQRWLQACTPPEPESPGEKLYEQWDCPQVIAKHEFKATEPDLLTLEPGDVVNVSRKMPDGWFQGERIRDGVTGWFPGSYTEEVNSAHVRARNLKQRHRLLTFAATYLEMQKKS